MINRKDIHIATKNNSWLPQATFRWFNVIPWTLVTPAVEIELVHSTALAELGDLY